MLAIRVRCIRRCCGKQLLQALSKSSEQKCGKSSISTTNCDVEGAESIGDIPVELTADVLLSEANRVRTIGRLRNAPLLGMRMSRSKSEGVSAAVLIALCTSREGNVSILYTRRSGQLSRHVRQTSFPGGIRDPSDVDYIDCALRETEEEIGLPRSRVCVWGTGALVTPPHTASIMPVVAEVRDFDLTELKLNEDEVEEAFTIPVAELSDPLSLRYTQFKSGYTAPVFVVRNHKVWGITGYLTHSFLNCLLPEGLRGRVKYIRPFTSS